jgi:hypothetical protein
MNNLLKKAGLGVALAATAITVSAPAEAQRWGGYRHYNRGGDTAGAAILGGIVGLGVGAAIASSNNNRYYDRGYYDRDYYAPPPPRSYYYDDYNYNYNYRPRCWNQWRWDPYYGRNVRVRVCN